MPLSDYELEVVETVKVDGKVVDAAVDHANRRICVSRTLWETPKLMLLAALPRLAASTIEPPPRIETRGSTRDSTATTPRSRTTRTGR